MAEQDKPKYQRLKEYIIETIQRKTLKPGDIIYSENELAEQFGISRHTVRQAIGELVVEGWLYRIQGKGTFVSSNLTEPSPPVKTVAVITTYMNDYIFPSIIRGIDGILSEQGYNILLGCTYNQHDKERQCLENLKGQSIAGLIVEPTKSALPNPNTELYQALKDRGIPILFIHGTYPGLPCSYVIEDDIQAGYLATRHLLSSGHTRVGGIFKIDDVQGHDRFAGFQKAHLEQGIPLTDRRVVWFNTDDMDTHLSSNGLEQLVELSSGCSAFVCYNDIIAVRLMETFEAMGLQIPGDISLVGFDDSQLAAASGVKLTSIAHPKEQLGEQAASAIITLIAQPEEILRVKIQPELVVRGSTRIYHDETNDHE